MFLLPYLLKTHDTFLYDGIKEISGLFFYSYWSLMFLWMKFTWIWRFFRLWSLLDDVDCVENMQRCMNNNYTVAGFWKGWHSSYNKFLVKYIFIPLGGNRVSTIRRVINTILIFAFVAIWHDLEPKLFLWGLLTPLVFIPETIGNYIFNKIKGDVYLDEAMIILGGGFMILLLMIVNMIGYTVGTDFFQLGFGNLVLSSEGFLFTLLFYSFMCSSAVLMRLSRGTLLGGDRK
eukprot:snap_masked-scaffold_4-processed-gene-11.39-mRNA-1 protein AED:0.11 eAED:0.12 QI:0/-1/0/1/-1/1/1/0/231